MKQIYFKDDFIKLTEREVNKWILFNFERLIGSAIFTKNKSITSKVVSWAEGWRCKENDFKPSHTGSIIKYANEIYLFDMKPLKAKIQPLADFLLNTTDDYILVLRDFIIDTNMFSLNIAEHIGEFYPFMSAVRSVFTKRQSKWRTHCSELHLRELQKQGLFKDINPEITPDELLHIFMSDSDIANIDT